MNGRRRYGTVIGVGLGAAALALAVGVPLGTILLIGVVLLCPLMMGMHGGGHEGHGAPSRTEQRADAGRQSSDEHAHHGAGRA